MDAGWTVWAILLAGLLATGLAIRRTRSEVESEEKADFHFACSEIRSKIVERFRAHEQILRSGAAFFDHSPGVSRQEWRRFTERQQLEHQLPGLQGIGFGLLIPRTNLAQHIQTIRAEGFPDYDVFPKGDRELYSPVIFLEPFTNRNLRAFGYDLFSEPVRRAAMERARDQDAAALSGRVTLLQENSQDAQAGTLMFVPVYRTGLPCDTVAQRRAAILGWAYSPYRMNDLLGGILGNWDQASHKRIRLEIFDGDQLASETRFYDSHAARSEPSGVAADAFPSEQSQVVLAGRPWALRFTRIGSQVGTVDYGKVWLVGFGGLITTLFLTGLIFSLVHARHNARRLAAELRQSEERYRSVIDNSPHAVFLADEKGLIIMANQAAARLNGYPLPQDLVGGLLTDLLEPRHRLKAKSVFEAALRDGLAMPFECSLQRRDGTVVHAEISSALVQGFQGLPKALLAMVEDKRMEAALRDMAGRHRLLINNMLDGYAHCRMVIDEQNQPVDFILLHVNPAFEELSGLPEIQGKRITEAVPHIKETNPELIEICGRVAATGKSEKFEFFFGGSNRWLSASLTQAGPGCFAAIFVDIHARKLAEEARRESEERLAEAQRVARIGNWSWELKTNQVAWSKEHHRILGLPFTIQPSAETFFKAVHPADAERVSKAVEGTLKHPQPYDLKFRIITAAGEERIVHTLGQVQNDAHGQPIRFYGTIQDITGHERAAAALRESEVRFSMVFRANLAGTAIIRAHGGVFIEVNDAFLTLFGYARPEVLGHSSDELELWPFPEQWRHLNKLLQDQGRAHQLEVKFRQKSGAIGDALISAEQIDLHGERHLVAMLLDITERKRMEELLFQSEAKLKCILDTAPVPFALLNEAGGITYLNYAFTDAFGYGKDHIPTVADWWLQAYPDPDYRALIQAEWQQRLDRAKLQGSGFEPVEANICCRDGTRRTVITEAKALSGTLEGEQLLLVYDITERKHAEEKMRGAYSRLECIIEGASLGTWEWNVQTGETVFNGIWAQIIGYKPEELAPFSIKTWETLAHPDDLRKSSELLQRHLIVAAALCG